MYESILYSAVARAYLAIVSVRCKLNGLLVMFFQSPSKQHTKHRSCKKKRAVKKKMDQAPLIDVIRYF